MFEFSLEKIRGLMAEKGLKQIDIADELGISLTSLNSRLTGKLEFTLREIKELARIFNVEFIITKGE